MRTYSYKKTIDFYETTYVIRKTTIKFNKWK